MEKSGQMAVIEKERSFNKKIQKSKTVIERMNGSEIDISFHRETNKMLVKLVDPETQEVLKEIPPEKLEDLFAALTKLSGMFVDEKV